LFYFINPSRRGRRGEEKGGRKEEKENKHWAEKNCLRFIFLLCFLGVARLYGAVVSYASGGLPL
jgi:hypothetical protein